MALSSRINYTDTTLGGAMLKRAVNYITLAKEELSRAKSLADSISGGGVTATNLNASEEFGSSVTQGQLLYDLIATMNANLAAVTATELSKVDHG